MTAAERQRRRRAGLGQYRDKGDVTKQDDARQDKAEYRDASPVTKPAGRTLLLSVAELDEWADRLDIDSEDLVELEVLLARRELQFLVDDPDQAARWMIRELRWPNAALAVQDLYAAFEELEAEFDVDGDAEDP